MSPDAGSTGPTPTLTPEQRLGFISVQVGDWRAQLLDVRPPEPGSSLAADDAVFPTLTSSQLAWQGIRSAVDHLDLFLSALAATGTGFPIAYGTLARAGVLGAAHALWLLDQDVDDITTFGGYNGHFATIIDSTLFHSLALKQRDGYLRAIAQAARPGATLHMLVFDRRAPLRPGPGPHAVDEAELREAISPHWTIDAITPSSIHAWTPEGFAAPIDRDDQGRALFPAFLLRAHLPDDHIPQPREPAAAHPRKIAHRP